MGRGAAMHREAMLVTVLRLTDVVFDQRALERLAKSQPIFRKKRIGLGKQLLQFWRSPATPTYSAQSPSMSRQLLRSTGTALAWT